MKCQTTAVLALVLLGFATALPAGESVERDYRLDQRVTLQCSGSRLHMALEQLSKETGVKIGCGLGSKDWPVRDIPVEVCARDIPLGRLLRAIADTTHLALTSRLVDGEKVYRIWRTGALAEEFEDYRKRMHEYGYARAAWEWDTVARLKDLPSEAMDGVDDRYYTKNFLAASSILATLGPECRDKILAGEAVTVSPSDASPDMKSSLEHYLRVAYAAYRNDSGFLPQVKTPSDTQFQSGYVELKTIFAVNGEAPTIQMECVGLPVDPLYIANVNVTAMLVGKRLVGQSLPASPQTPEVPQPFDENYYAKAWDIKIKLELPKGKTKETATFADACAAISAATGYAVVAENFHGHQKFDNPRQVFARFESETPLGQVRSVCHRMAWSVDEQSKILYCWERMWPDSHRCLAPEALIEPLKRKLDAEGVDLDDIVPCCGLDKMQISEWIDSSETLSALYPAVTSFDKPIWAFYSSLKSKQKAQVRSDKGLALVGSSFNKMAEIFRAREPELVGAGGIATKEMWWETNPGARPVTSITLRLKTTETIQTHALGRREYSMEFNGRRGTDRFMIRVPSHLTYPVYSPGLEQELKKAAQTLTH